eukprot:GHRQ01039362.1.p2 GENE.GHRQ01039362.1~~GHRQ01039362.1.p2  ORF type:complete len:108 (-),score=19.63 GHRQ01039362.1:470-793(-)
MNVDQPTPRVGFPQLKNFIGKSVIFVGKVEAMQGQQVQMSAPDGSRVTVQGNSTFDSQFAEVTGVVVDPMTLREESHVEFGEKFGEQQQDSNICGSSRLSPCCGQDF